MKSTLLVNGTVHRGKGLDDDKLLIVDGIIQEWDAETAGSADEIVWSNGSRSKPEAVARHPVFVVGARCH